MSEGWTQLAQAAPGDLQAPVCTRRAVGPAAQAEHDKHWRRAGTLAICLVVLFVASWFAYPTGAVTWLSRRVPFDVAYVASAFVLLFSGLLLAFCHSVHAWSIVVVSELYEKVQADLAGKEDIQLLGHRPCGFCGHRPAPIICKDCDSIQWADLRDPERVAIAADWRWSLAAFVAHHRWKLLAAILSVVVVGLFAFVANVKAELWRKAENEQEAFERNIQVLIDAMVGYRSRLLDLEVSCPASASPGCANRYAALADAYFRWSWHSADVLRQLHGVAGCTGAPDGSALAVACGTTKREFEADQLDHLFQAYTNAFADAARDASRLRSRRDAAQRLFARGRVLGCAIVVLRDAPRDAELANNVFYGDCVAALRDALLVPDPGQERARFSWDWPVTSASAEPGIAAPPVTSAPTSASRRSPPEPSASAQSGQVPSAATAPGAADAGQAPRDTIDP